MRTMRMSRPSSTALSAAGLNINDLRQVIKLDIEASNELQIRIDQLRLDILDGKILPENKIDLMEDSNKDMTRDLVKRIEKIEKQGKLTPTDREMLQALNARLAVCDTQAMRMAELRSLERDVQREILATKELPLGGIPRRASPPGVSPPAKVTEHLRPDFTPQPSPVRPTARPVATSSRGQGPGISHSKRRDSAEVSGCPYAYFEDADSDEDRSWHVYHNGDIMEPDKSRWPLLYRIIDVDPATDPRLFEHSAIQSMMRLSLKHDPARLPSDPDAPARWAAIQKAFDTLVRPERKKSCDLHRGQLKELKDFDLSKLSINDTS